MKRLLNLLGSLAIAVPLLVIIAGVLAWGTIYETRYGTASVQRFVYHAWWFQAVLAFLGINLAVSALERYPWKRRHLPFLLAHIGIISILIGGILGSRLGVEGQLIIPEGEAEKTLLLPQTELLVHQPNPGTLQRVPMDFETQAWVHEPNRVVPITLEGQSARLTIDRYYPNAQVREEITGGGADENPAIQLRLGDGTREDRVWLLAHDAERFAIGWQDAHALFLDLTPEQASRWFADPGADAHPRGTVVLEFDGGLRREIPVPDDLTQPVAINGTDYQVRFKDYFSDLAITEQGVANRSQEPNNPAVSFTLIGPEGADAFLLFAFHPDFAQVHGRQPRVHAKATYRHPASAVVPPNAIAILRHPSGVLSVVVTGPAGERHVAAIEPGQRHRHPWTGYEFEVLAYEPRATVAQQFTNRSNQVKREAVHAILERGHERAEAWLLLGSPAELRLGGKTVILQYQKAQRELPVTIKLLDFRRIDYPGTDMPQAFEADVQMTDPARGLILMRTIKMNKPLKYKGYSFFQASFIPSGPGEPETTVLAVRNDPGTPLVYAGFLTVIAGVVSLFVSRSPAMRVQVAQGEAS